MERDALTPTNRCLACGECKPTTEFHKYRQGRLYSKCKTCRNYSQRQWSKVNHDKARAYKFKSANKDPYRHAFIKKKSHAKRTGIEFSIQYEDIVWNAVCPVLGIPLSYERYVGRRGGTRYNSPSFDRINPLLGYVKGNVIIVSARANMIKSNATVDELKKVAAFYEQLIPPVGGSDVQETD